MFQIDKSRILAFNFMDFVGRLWNVHDLASNCLLGHDINASFKPFSQYKILLILTLWSMKTSGERPSVLWTPEPMTEAGACFLSATFYFRLSLDFPSNQIRSFFFDHVLLKGKHFFIQKDDVWQSFTRVTGLFQTILLLCQY